MLTLAHVAIVTPGRCGLYETTRELVVGLRALGVDSRIHDPGDRELHPGGDEDRGAKFCDLDWAKRADILIEHSGLGPLADTGQPVIHVAHGRPRSSFLIERRGGAPIQSYHYLKNKDPRFTAVVTFWPSHVPYHEVIWTQTPVYSVTPPVDLDAWSPEGPSGYDFHGKGGSPNIICTDAWRDDIDPWPVVNAFALYARKFPKAKLHIYGAAKDMKGWGAVLKTIEDQGNRGEISTWVRGLANVYRAADMLITPHTIAVRSIRESMACGCPVAIMGSPDIGEFANSMETMLGLDRAHIRRKAEEIFDPRTTAREFLDVVNAIDVRAAA